MAVWKYIPAKKQELELRMEEHPDGAVTIRAEGVERGMLVTFESDGTLFLHASVNDRLGLQLDEDGRIVVKGDY